MKLYLESNIDVQKGFFAMKLLTCVSRSEEESDGCVGEGVSTVVKDPEKSPSLTNSILPFNNLNPKGHPSSCIHHKKHKHKKNKRK